MLTIVKSVLSSVEETKALVVSTILEEASKDLSPQELKVFQYLKQGYDTFSQFPTEELFLKQFPEYYASLQEISPLNEESLDYYKREFIEKHKRITLSKKLLTMATTIQQSGLTPDMVESLRGDADNKQDEFKLETSNIIDLYNNSKRRGNCGIKTYIPEVDQLIGTIEPGTLTTIVGYNKHGKTTFALNMAYKAARDGKHVVYISLEVAEQFLLYDLISLHSTSQKFGIEPIPSDSIRLLKLSEEQERNFEIVADDFNKTIKPNLLILTERNFKDFSYGEIRDVLYRIDAEKRLEAVFVDQASLFKFYAKGNTNNLYDVINDYVSFFRKLAICFKVENGVDRQMIIVLLAQCNRTGVIKAELAGKKDPAMEGKYDDTAVAESNELTRSCSYLMTVYSTQGMRLSHEARVQLLRCRFGQTHEDPIVVNFNPECKQFGEMDDLNQTSVNNYAHVSSFGSFVDINPSDLGFNLSDVDLSDL